MKLKKSIVVLLLITIILSGCTQGAASTQSEKFLIGISQLVEHPALDASKQGFIDELKNQGIDVELIEQNAQGDPNNALMIAQKFVKDDVDLIFTIATLTSQATKQAISGTDIPLVFTAVTDPVFSQLVADLNVTDNNITGVVDAAPIKENLQLFKELKEDVKKSEVGRKANKDIDERKVKKSASGKSSKAERKSTQIVRTRAGL